MTDQQFLDTLDAIVNERQMLQHPFYIMWNEGKLTKEMLREYALEYYSQVLNFPTYVSATHANCDDFEVRQMLLENLIEEEHGDGNHPALWRRFAQSLGVDEQELNSRKYLSHTRESVRILKDLARRENPAEGLAALYAYESQIPAVSSTKIKGLKEFYNLDCEDATIFFSVHEHADEIHSKVTREALVKLCKSENEMQAALDAAREASDAFNLLLDGVYENFCSDKHSV